MRHNKGKVAKTANPTNGDKIRWAGMNSVVQTQARVKNIREITNNERNYLVMGIMQPGGKLPLFDDYGQEINASIIKSCMKKGLVERWFANPLKPDWLVCRLTEKGRRAVR